MTADRGPRGPWPSAQALRIEHLRQRLRGHGAQPAHEQRFLLAWARAISIDTRHRRAQDFLPLGLRRALPSLTADLSRLARLRCEYPGADGSARLLIELADGQTLESVLLPRGGLCVSTQIGCAVGCTFCMTGRDGLRRQVGSAEIVAQVALARGLRPVTRVLFMGMGEPAHNLDAVLEAIELLGTLGAIGHKDLVFSTVGDRRGFPGPRASTRRSSSNWASATRGTPAIRFSTNGPYLRASTTATRNSTPSPGSSPASAP